jgi:phenylacetate-CoA ligase
MGSAAVAGGPRGRRRFVLTAPVLHTSAADPTVAERLIGEFQRAAEHVPAYRTLLEEAGVRAIDVQDVWAFSTLCPLLSKVNTFDRFPLPRLCVGGALHDLAEVLTSSGHGGRFSFGVISRAEAAASGAFVDAALDPLFRVRTRKTLAINCLPMGVVVSSQCMTVATTSVREDMAVSLVKTFGSGYDQIVLIGDPLFMKRLTDHAVEQALDWTDYRVNAVVGEETFGEHFRGYLGSCLGLYTGRPDSGRVISSFGVAELGLHLCFETAATLGLARAAAADATLAHAVLGAAPGAWPPMVLSFEPQRTFIEIVDPDEQGYGRLTISMLDPGRQLPLLRYQTGDVAKLLDREEAAATLGAHGVAIPDLPPALLALRGRTREALPNGAHVGLYKDALYANRELARRFTGATRLIFSGGRFTMHVQLVKGQKPAPVFERGLMAELPADVRPSRLVLWPYAQFPFGMGLDYERKFSHYVPGEPER